MSNQAISIYAQALKRQQSEELPSQRVSGQKTKKSASQRVSDPTSKQSKQPSNQQTNQPANQSTMPPSNHATMPPRYHATMVETLRKRLKEVGKEAATHRLTPEEKRALTEVIFKFFQKGVRTNENEITRIAVNFVLEDYRENGKRSLLNAVLERLHA